MKISVFGNRDYSPDSMPLKIMPELVKRFPEFVFAAEDPNELAVPPEDNWYIIDAVVGLKKVQIIEMADLKKARKGQISMHGFDLATHLFWLNKLKRDLKVHIIGIPPQLSYKEALDGAGAILASLRPENGKRS